MKNAIVNRFQAGMTVEARDPASGAWRRGVIQQVENYRGREGYYVLWVFEGPREMWQSGGGWQPGSCVRAIGGDDANG